VIIGPFLFDGLARPGPFFDGPHTGRAKTGRDGPFATPNFLYLHVNGTSTHMIVSEPAILSIKLKRI